MTNTTMGSFPVTFQQLLLWTILLYNLAKEPEALSPDGMLVNHMFNIFWVNLVEREMTSPSSVL